MKELVQFTSLNKVKLNMKFVVILAIISLFNSASSVSKRAPNSPYCSVVRTKYDRANVYSRNFLLTDRRWPGGIILYEMDTSLSTRERRIIMEALEDIETKTCLKFVGRGDKSPYVYITNRHGGCYAEIGYFPGRRMTTLNLQNDYCDAKYIATHEMLHIAGMEHEQNRPDRDEYVRINWENIDPGLVHNFYKDAYPGSNLPTCKSRPDILDKNTCVSGYVTETYGLPYEYKSIMHYEGKASSVNGKPTIEPLKTSEKLDINDYLTHNDLLKINTAYCNGRPFPSPGPLPCKDDNDACAEWICKADTKYAKDNCQKTCNFCPT